MKKIPFFKHEDQFLFYIKLGQNQTELICQECAQEPKYGRLDTNQFKQLIGNIEQIGDSINNQKIEQNERGLHQYILDLNKNNCKELNIVLLNILNGIKRETKNLNEEQCIQSLKFNEQFKTIDHCKSELMDLSQLLYFEEQILSDYYKLKIINKIESTQNKRICCLKPIFLSNRDGLSGFNFRSKVKGKSNLLMIFNLKVDILLAGIHLVNEIIIQILMFKTTHCHLSCFLILMMKYILQRETNKHMPFTATNHMDLYLVLAMICTSDQIFKVDHQPLDILIGVKINMLLKIHIYLGNQLQTQKNVRYLKCYLYECIKKYNIQQTQYYNLLCLVQQNFVIMFVSLIYYAILNQNRTLQVYS
ncbi:unnamed protein product [Paramecium octaurelia]|uniref:Uncharacterized protein n=1 Tax=Paramecium octaurelia TaxID=43137 RepID=A0A8S1UG15_PAROT|nr:unnamed protein product [Paramecium octaurelia]